jgi:putative ABC transport system permease protein
VFIPVTTASKRLFNRNYLTSISLKMKDPENPEAGIEEVSSILRDRHRIAANVENDFTIRNPRAAAQEVSEVRSTLSTILIGVAAIATIIGGTVIMSLMLIAVSERRNEIGVRRAVGATRSDIMLQFLIEAGMISLIGGLAGVVLGIVGAAIAASQQQLPPVMMWSVVFGATFMSVLIGLIFGLQPAWKAANTDPIEALRS